jgi:ATP-binding cassette, subfamily B, bacterial
MQIRAIILSDAAAIGQDLRSNRVKQRGRFWAMRTLMGMAWRADRRNTVQILAVMAAQVFADGIVSLSLRWIVDGAVAGRTATAVTAGIVGGFALAVGHVGGRIVANLQSELAERVRLMLDREVLTMSATLDGLEHLERPDHLDRIMLVRQQSRALAEFGWSALSSASLTIRLLVSLGLLLTINPLLVGLAVVFVLPLLLGRVGQRRVQQSITDTATSVRLQKHLHQLCTKPGPGKEIRIARCGEDLDRRAAAMWDTTTTVQLRAKVFAASLSATGWILFALGYAGALLLVTWQALHGRGSAGDIVLVASVVSQLRQQTNGRGSVIGKFVVGLHVLDQYRWLRDYAAALTPVTGGPAVPVPDTLSRGIDLADVSFRYPGTETEILHSLTAHLPAGSVVAIVGEHGAGKTTLIKLLCGFYQPTTGQILVDDTPLEAFGADPWRTRLSAAFQDFGQFEFLARETIGVGDLPHIPDDPALYRALDRAQARDVVTTLPASLNTQLGRTFSHGVDLSHGQWQKLALSRAFMRDAPLLLVLDEPTASLDATAEQNLFENYTTRARTLSRSHGAITLIVSHRFSTVRMADLILVLQDGTITESGTHNDLIHKAGLYATLYNLQATAYRSNTDQ